ncbi:hypothetical protein GCM10009599_00540 [Luteococcus peritonei]
MWYQLFEHPRGVMHAPGAISSTGQRSGAVPAPEQKQVQR